MFMDERAENGRHLAQLEDPGTVYDILYIPLQLCGCFFWSVVQHTFIY